MTKEERSILEALDGVVRSETARARIQPIIERVRADLAGKSQALMAWEPVALEAQRDSHIDDRRRHPVVGNGDQVIEQLAFLASPNGPQVGRVTDGLQPRLRPFDFRVFPAADIMPPEGTKTIEWIESWPTRK